MSPALFEQLTLAILDRLAEEGLQAIKLVRSYRSRLTSGRHPTPRWMAVEGP